jgi:hypothetical protein
MTTPIETAAYLEEAAAELRKARADNDRRATFAEELATAKLPGSAEIRAETSARSLEIAEGFTRLAAIEAGLPPCYHPLREHGQEGP